MCGADREGVGPSLKHAREGPFPCRDEDKECAERLLDGSGGVGDGLNPCSSVEAYAASPASPQPVGTTVTFTATANCPSGVVPEFEFFTPQATRNNP